ncbi:MAG: ribbon-helix-helix domain-containing protein [Thermoanaerobaculia bacterium]
MRTNLEIDGEILDRLKEEAARRGCSVSELMERAIRLLLDPQQAQPPALPPLPTFDSGGALVDISDRNALYQAMEGF